MLSPSSILTGSPQGDRASQDRRLHIFFHCIDVLQKNDLDTKTASRLVGLLMLEVHVYVVQKWYLISYFINKWI